jgi:hypothetical protein
MIKQGSFLLFVILFSAINTLAQDVPMDSTIRVTGKILDELGAPKSDLLIINERKFTGEFGNTDGTFDITANKSDVLVFGAIGYASFKVSYKDSVYKDVYTINLRLKPLQIRLGAAEIIAPRDLDRIQRDIQKLGYNEKDFRVSGVNAISSPITFLYEMFSQRERSRRLAIELENDDRRRDLLKELFAKYVDYEIIDLSENQFDDFIDFLNVSDQVLKSSSQYDFIVYVGETFKRYKRDNFIKPLDDSEYYYHED